MCFGTVGAGVLFYDGTNWKIKSTVSGFPSNYINCMTKGNDGSLWFGTQSYAASWDGAKVKIDSLYNGNSVKIVKAITIDKDNVKWFGTSGGGITSFDGTSRVTYTTSNGLPGNYINAAATDSENVKWFGTTDVGLAAFDGSKWFIFKTVGADTLKDIRAISVDSNNVKWVGTSDGKIWEFDVKKPLTDDTSAVEVNAEPMLFKLNDAFPNPFNPTTTISYNLSKNMNVILTVYNAAGQKVSMLKDGFETAGSHSVVWDAKNMPNGVYFCTLKGTGLSQTKKMLLVK
jgi:ligand-binding sensor domain-containing protein